MFYPAQAPPNEVRCTSGGTDLLLRRSRVSDAPELVNAIEESVQALRAFMPWVHFPKGNTVAAQEERLQGLDAAWEAKQEFVYHMFRVDEGGQERFVGCIGLHPRCNHSRALEVGYWVRTAEAGQGVCTLAVQLVVLTAFQHLNLERLQVGCDRANLGSRRVIEKVGFPYEGALRNMLPFECPASIRENGWLGTGTMCMYALIPSDLNSLEWVAPLSSRLQSSV